MKKFNYKGHALTSQVYELMYIVHALYNGHRYQAAVENDEATSEIKTALMDRVIRDIESDSVPA